MSPFLVVIFFLLVVGLGGLFLTTSALCGKETVKCLNGDSFGYPFINGDKEYDCGYHGLTFACSNEESRPVMSISNKLYYVLRADMKSKSFTVEVEDVVDEELCPRPKQNFTLPPTSPFLDPYGNNSHTVTYFYNCSSGYPEDVVQGLPCLDTSYNTTGQLRSFAFFSNDSLEHNWFTRNCQENVVVPVQSVHNYSDIEGSLKLGFYLEWSTPRECKGCEKSGGQCWFNHTEDGVHHACSCPQHGTDRRNIFHKVCPIQPRSQGVPIKLKIILGVCSGIGGLLLVALLICQWKLFSLHRSTTSHSDSKIKSSPNMEAFLQSCGCHGLQRYKYSQVKKMTNTFNVKLGQGGFGSVFKGKLPDGSLVAVKVLDESRGYGEDFVNEVATIGWTNHVNVVRLLGFCSDGHKRALVYEFMPNGSLEKFLHNRENTNITNPPLGWEKLYQIALGIAKGLEYLHCGCNTRILHFDIKPHNILLGQDFCPKISDFGLAKLCQTRESIVSMHVARGTVGYIAPEVYCRNFGGVSNKSDVYSYGMMIFEMIGGRQNIDATVENISETYFPEWIYNNLKRDNGVDEAKEFYTEKTKKMIIVALWCIQTQPSDRPSISKVVEMLEGNVDELQMPSNTFQGSPSRSFS